MLAPGDPIRPRQHYVTKGFSFLGLHIHAHVIGRKGILTVHHDDVPTALDPSRIVVVDQLVGLDINRAGFQRGRIRLRATHTQHTRQHDAQS